MKNSMFCVIIIIKEYLIKNGHFSWHWIQESHVVACGIHMTSKRDIVAIVIDSESVTIKCRDHRLRQEGNVGGTIGVQLYFSNIQFNEVRFPGKYENHSSVKIFLLLVNIDIVFSSFNILF